jgi:hypothetical protein
VTKTFKVSHDPALVEKLRDVIGFGLFGRTAFRVEKVLGNVVSAGVKVLVLALIICIGSTIVGFFIREYARAGRGRPHSTSQLLSEV